MDRVFVDSANLCPVAGSWSTCCDYTQLHAVLTQAATRASQTERATLASLVLPVSDNDPLQVFRAFQYLYAHKCLYWEQPARQMALVGAGSAVTIETDGSGRFIDTAHAWQQLSDEAVIYDLTRDSTKAPHGPVLLGGFSFDPLNPSTSLWRGFPAGLLILPRLLFSQRAGQNTLTLSCLVHASDDLDDLASALAHELTSLRQLVSSLPPLSVNALAENHGYTMRDVWPAENWKNLVGQTVQAIQRKKYAKIVLAREVVVTADKRPFALVATLQRLRQGYPGANIFAFQRSGRAFIGATPERLIHAQDGTLHTMALAGSAPRGMTEEEDRRLGSELLQSLKNREEHEIVAASVQNALTHLCSRVWVADTPELLRLKNIQHLQTAIVGELLPGRSILEALATLHPTPAVGGSPTEPSLAFIRAHENLDRGWYSGPIGWIDLQGNGEFAVALRSALLEDAQARLFAGCGIVADSDPEAEYAESCLKLQVILRSLSGEE
jgi:isochorismate synthase